MSDVKWQLETPVYGRRALGRAATHEDLEALPADVVGEIIDGQLFVSPGPRPRHARATMSLSSRIFDEYDRKLRAPDGWWILAEPGIELPGAPEVVPDIAGWRRSRLPTIDPGQPIRVAPDWVCEVSSPSTRNWDFVTKRPFCARSGVAWLWSLDPEWRLLQVSRLEGGKWLEEQIVGGSGRVRLLPFEDVELDLDEVWPFEPDGSLVAHDSK